MYAKKLNRVIKVTDANKDYYLNNGYDIVEKGKVIEHAKNKKVSVSEYEKLMAENEKLKAELEKAKGKGKKEE